ncbi:MAG: GntG family PLP-dependent aldolase [Actinomycetes bacterium]
MIDLRSDTVTRPNDEMRAAIASASVGDDVYGDDPTVNALEEKVAHLFGKEAGVFTPTGSLSNQLGIRTLVKPGEELLTETFAHIVRAELGAGAAFSGITTRTWEGNHGLLVAEDAMAIARPDSGPYLVSTTAIAVENTHNFAGGTVQSIDEIRKLRALTSKVGIATHLDGARIWNAHIATGVSFKDYGENFDTVSVCFSKGLGAPIGSMLLSTNDRIKEARVWRKRYGAGMRQVGLLAAGADYALENNLQALAEDHRRAREIAVSCAAVVPNSVDLDFVHTNIVVLNLAGARQSAQEISAALKTAGILSSALGPTTLRLVTHRDLSDSDISKTNSVLPELLERAFKS